MKLQDIRQLSHRLSYTASAASQEQVHSLLREMGYDPNNLYQELEMSSSLVDTHRDTSYANAHLHLHSHTFYELLYCRSNCDAEYLVGAERYRLQRGDIVFIPPGISHRPLLPEVLSEPYKRYVLWLSPEFMKHYTSLTAFHPLEPTLFRTDGTQWDHLGDFFRQGVQEAENQAPGWEAAVLGNTVFLLTQLHRGIRDRSLSQMTAETPDLLDRILTYIEDHLALRITLADTAKHFFVSESTVSQTFRKKLGVSFYRCVTQRRLIAAKTLIQANCNLETVGQQVGFTDYSTFYRAFRKEYGISPRQYRKLHQLPAASKTE